MRMLSKGRTKVAVLTTEPANPANPTVAELNAGIDAADYIPRSMWTWSAGDPNTVDDSPLSSRGSAVTPDEATYDLGFGVYRGFAAAGGFDPAEDALFQATKVMGTTLWVYARKTDKLSTAAWADGDEIYLGGEVQTSSPKNIDEGNIKYEVPFFPQAMHEFITAGAAVAAQVSSLDPTTGGTAGGNLVTINGNGFLGVTAVAFGANPATSFEVVSGSKIVAIAPGGVAGQVDVTVTNSAGTSATGAQTKYTYA